MAEIIYVGDYGWVIKQRALDQNGAVQDISGFTTAKQFYIRAPDGTIVAKTGTFTSDGTDGYLQYTVESDLIDAAGTWEAQMRIQSGSAVLSGTPVEYTAKARYEAN